MLPEPLVNPAREYLGRPFVIRLEIILAERIIGKAVPHQNARQVGVAGEANAHHVVDFALLEISALISLVKRGNLSGALGFRSTYPQLDQLAWLVDRIELVIDLDAVFKMHALQAGQ